MWTWTVAFIDDFCTSRPRVMLSLIGLSYTYVRHTIWDCALAQEDLRPQILQTTIIFKIQLKAEDDI